MRDTMQSKKHQVRKWYVCWEMENVNKIVDNKQSSWLNFEYYSSELCSRKCKRLHKYNAASACICTALRERKKHFEVIVDFPLTESSARCMHATPHGYTVQVQCTRMRVGAKFSARWSDDSALARLETLLLTWQGDFQLAVAAKHRQHRRLIIKRPHPHTVTQTEQST